MSENAKSRMQTMAAKLSEHALTVALKFSVIAVVVVALYFQDLGMVFVGALTSESTYHILAIPFLFGYLVYRKRRMINASLQNAPTSKPPIQEYFSVLAGIILFAIATFAYWWGSYSFTPLEYHMLTLPFAVSALILILFNTQTLKQLLFPVCFLFFLTPPPDAIFYGMGSALSNFSASASTSLANAFGFHAALSSNNLGPVVTLIRQGVPLSFNVDVACSGIYSIIGFTIFAVFVAYITRGRLWNKLAVLIMGIPLILALNVIRITAILGIGYNFGESLALQFFHAIGATVLMFLGTLLLLAITDKAFKTPQPTPPCINCEVSTIKPAEPFCTRCGKLLKTPKATLSSRDATVMVSILLVTILLLSIQAPVFALTKGPAQVITQTAQGTQINVSNSILPTIGGYSLIYAYRDTQFEQESGDEAALVYRYDTVNSTDPDVWVSIQISSSITSEHQWETCLVNFPLSQGNSPPVNQLDLRDIQLQSNPPMTARYFAFQYKGTNQTQIVLYWYSTAVFSTNSTSQTKSVMTSLIIYQPSTQNITAAENQELPVAEEINNYWQPIRTWSVVALVLSQNGLDISLIACVAFAFLLLYRFFYDRDEKKLLVNLYRKLFRQSKDVVDAVETAAKQGNPTTEGVLAELRKTAGFESADDKWLLKKLAELESINLIEKKLANRRDMPSIEWRSNVDSLSN